MATGSGWSQRSIESIAKYIVAACAARTRAEIGKRIGDTHFVHCECRSLAAEFDPVEVQRRHRHGFLAGLPVAGEAQRRTGIRIDAAGCRIEPERDRGAIYCAAAG